MERGQRSVVGGGRRMAGAIVVMALAFAASGCAAEFAALEAESRFTRGCAHHLEANLALAEGEYRASLALAPSSAAANNLGVIEAGRGRLDDAARWFAYAV